MFIFIGSSLLIKALTDFALRKLFVSNLIFENGFKGFAYLEKVRNSIID